MTCGTLGFDVVSSFFTVPVAVLLGGRIDTELTSVQVQSASMGRTQDAAAASTIGIDAAVSSAANGEPREAFAMP